MEIDYHVLFSPPESRMKEFMGEQPEVAHKQGEALQKQLKQQLNIHLGSCK